MADRRQLLRAGLLAAAGLATGTACGVPSGGPPVVDGDGPRPGGGPSGGSSGDPPGPAGTSDPVELVRRYLDSLSGRLDTDDARQKATDRAKSFLTPNAQGSWSSSTTILVVREKMNPPIAATGPNGYTVTTQLQPVGVIDDGSGAVKPTSNVKQFPAAFAVVPNPDPKGAASLLIDQLPAGLGPVLRETALTQWFTAQLLYFWDLEQRGLVPDLRYVPTSVVDAARATEIVNWLLAGPSTFLQGAVQPTTPGVQLVGPNVTLDPSGHLVVVFGGVPQNADLTNLIAQVRWSLRPAYKDTLNVSIQGRQAKLDGSSTGYLDKNLAVPGRNTEPQPYAISGGVVKYVPDPSVVPPVLDAPENAGVQRAALSRDDSPLAALVRDGQLWLGRPGSSGAPPVYQRVAQLPPISERPMWLAGDSASVLVRADDGLLYQVGAGTGTPVTPVAVGGVNQITAFSVAPDQRRIALIGDDAVWIAPLTFSQGAVSVGSNPRKIYTAADTPDLRSIAWTRLDRVLVAGGSGPWVLNEVMIDGTNAQRFQNNTALALNNQITQVVAYPYPPTTRDVPPSSGPVMVQAGNTAYRVYPSVLPQLDYDSRPTPSPGASAAPLAAPINPFFVD
jgi:Sporulation and spore germination